MFRTVHNDLCSAKNRAFFGYVNQISKGAGVPYRDVCEYLTIH